MSTKGKNSINIPVGASGHGLREELEIIAKRRATNIARVVAQIYTYAVDNQGKWPEEIEPREKPGKHISTQVSSSVASKLKSWAEEQGRSRTHHCCFILEYFVSDPELRKAVFPKNKNKVS